MTRWKSLEKFPGYTISDQGDVYSFLTQRTLKPGIMKRGGYPLVVVGVAKPVHRLVAEAFLGPCPEGYQVRHLDGDPTNNTINNLAYGTQSDNEADKRRHGRDNGGQRNGRAVLTDDLVREIKILDHLTGREIARLFAISEATVSRIRSGACWGHVGRL